jgi:predicted branched-subunit amino acid permease
MTSRLAGLLSDRGVAGAYGRPDVAPALAGVRDTAPAVFALVPVALALGASIDASPVDDRIGLAGAVLVYAASAHATAVAMLGTGAAGFAIVLTVFVLTVRGAVFSVGMVSRMRQQPAWFRWIAPYLLVDPLYADVTARTTEEDLPEWFRRYYLGAGLAIWLMWLPTVTAGVLLGPVLPRSAAIDFALPALLVAFLIPGLRSRPAVAAALAGGAIALLELLPGGLNLIVASGIGVAVAMAVERRAS